LSSSFWRVSLRLYPSAPEADPNAIVLPLSPGIDLQVHRGK
jgi:hypothetical protein